MKLAFVTGAASGTGRAIAERFAREGWGICLSSRSGARAQEAARALGSAYGVPSFGFGLAPGNEQAVQEGFGAIAGEGHWVGALVLCAADLGIGQDSLTVPLADFRSVLETNLVWNFSLCRAAAQQMRAHGGGAIVFIGSNTSRRAIPGRAAYICSKGGMTSLAKALAVDWGKFGIRVNILHSGSIKTARWNERTEQQRRASCARAPIGDVAEFEDIACAAYFLASGEARVITGAELCVDGGADAQLFPPAPQEAGR